MKKNIKWLVISLSMIMVLSCASTITGLLPEESNNIVVLPTYESLENAPSFDTIPVPDIGNTEEILTALYSAVNPGIVAIQVITDAGDALGSGFVIDLNGHIVTNYHVVEGEQSIEIDFPSGFKTYGEVIGTDLDSDIAIIDVDVPETQLHPLALGDSSQLRVGQTVVAIGNPYGLTGTMTVGVVSALGRTLDSQRQTASGAYYTAADLNPDRCLDQSWEFRWATIKPER